MTVLSKAKKIYLLSHSQPEAPEDLNKYLKKRSIVYLSTVLVALCIVGLLFLCVSLLVSILLEELNFQNKDLAVLMFHCCTSLWRFFFLFSLCIFIKKKVSWWKILFSFLKSYMYPQSVALHISPLFLSRVFFSFFSSAAHSGTIKFKTTGQHVCRITNELMISSSLLCIPFLLPIYLWFICRSIVLSPQLLLPGFCLLFVSHQSIHWFWDYFRASLFHQFLFDTIKSNCSFSPSLSSCLLGCTMHSVLSVSHVSITYVSIIL